SKLSTLLPEAAAKGILSPHALVIASLLVFCGVVGKSAQFPLYIWLPDAMEGPTPVSALIHAATMVAAGVYLMSRSFFLFSGSIQTLDIIAVTGAATALLAALLAIVQNDIKKILAYSTISQLGYMVMALGLGSSSAAMYHLTTHAFFKALLFLGAGAMIHGLHTQDIWEMGGLVKRMPVTAITFLIGTLALCGIYPFSGFFSKDEILTLAYGHHRSIYFAALVTAGLTAFYMSRACWIAVLGEKRINKHAQGHDAVHEAPPIMSYPLIMLAILSCAGGFIGIGQFLTGERAHEAPLNMVVAVTSTLAALAGIGLGTLLYAKLGSKADPLKQFFGIVYNFVVKKYYLDEFFSGIANFFNTTLAKILYWFDWNIVIQKMVNGTAGITSGVAAILRLAQTGYVQTYTAVFGLGLAAMVYFMLLKG
ncbi:MAG: NADH-quinone oxidoreductase subunit L, partial [Candidatus Omnitrophica bacterium CG07_land_8_20_14_0_80_50_8]